MATLTALRRARPGLVALEVDGHPWRTVPDDVVVRCGLHAGLPLDRPSLRLLRTELRRVEALAAAGRALAARPLSRHGVSRRLRGRGVAPAAEREALATLEAAGIIDDAGLARARAAALAERGWGNAAVEARLATEGFVAADVDAAVAELPPEAERAARLADSIPDGRKAWSRLARRGFSAEAIESALPGLDGRDGCGLG